MSQLFFDTETTGLALFKEPFTHPGQPKLVQLAAVLRDDSGQERASVNILVQPDGWKVAPAAANVHGISTETADKYGVGLDNAVHLFTDLVDVADEIVAHNIKYDMLVMRHAAHLLGQEKDMFDGKKITCTMQAATPILKIRQARGRGYKWPKLEECYQYYFNKTLEGAHDALVDVRACAEVYDELHKMKAFG